MVRHRWKRLFAPAFACLALSCSLAWPQNPVPPTTTASEATAKQDAPAPSATKAAPSAPVTVMEDTLIRVRTSGPINSKRAEQGSPVLFTVSEDVLVGETLVIPRGATVRGVVIKSKKAGRLTGSPELTLELASLTLGLRSYPLVSYQFKLKGTSKTQPTETKTLRGAEVGAIVSTITTGVSAKGPVTQGPNQIENIAAVAAVGAGMGTLVSAASPGPGIWIPSESQVDFFLAAPVTIVPVSAKDAARLAQGLHAGGPTLYLRGDTP